jgi:hypothetical protein
MWDVVLAVVQEESSTRGGGREQVKTFSTYGK